ncbi:MAG TPA: sigma-54 dependent transcriptional regulator [Cyclobacteriaceae bacterium]|nr:sigma-54 dependent transcriptional regulator [Cyclobacteriaceae bacterium]
MAPKVLIIDDEDNLRKLMCRIIELEGYKVFEVATAKAATKILETETIHVVVSDVKLPDGNGIDLTAKLKQQYPAVEFIVLTAYGTIQDGVNAIKKGAFDYLIKGEHQEKLLPLLSKACEKSQLQQKVLLLEKKLSDKFGFENVLGTSSPIQQAVELARKVSNTDATVLLRGETGTGKEVFAQAIHYSGSRKTKSFVAVNCSALGKDILESELFGHKAGSFTGAIKDQKGLFEEAHEGTIFLDEIGEMSLELQTKLLRVLETNAFLRIGDTKETKVNVRVIAATNRDLADDIHNNRFREDLFYRLSVFQIKLPALRERKQDIQALTLHFIALFAAKVNKRISGMTNDFIEALEKHEWRGNVRELKNIIERSIILCDQEKLTQDFLPFDFNTTDNGSLDLESVEKNHIKKVLDITNGNKTEAAKILKIGLTTLYQKIKDYQL